MKQLTVGPSKAGRPQRGQLRRALTDLEAAEIAAGYPEVYYVGDAATQPVTGRCVAKKTEDPAADDSKKSYDDEEGYYVHVPHDQIAYR